MAKPVYKRVLLKISGEALAGDKHTGLDFEVIGQVCDVIKECLDMGVQVGLVVGGGNFWRGAKNSGGAMERTPEGRRWEDIHRLAADDLLPSGGIPAKIEYNNVKNQGAFVVGGEVKAEWFGNSKQFIPYTDKRFIWPIPLNDILRNPTLAAQQNAGW